MMICHLCILDDVSKSLAHLCNLYTRPLSEMCFANIFPSIWLAFKNIDENNICI